MRAETEATLIIRSYAEALFNTSRKQGIVTRLIDEAKMLDKLLEQEPSFRYFLEGPQIPTEDKHAVIAKVLKDRLNPLMFKLLSLIVDRERALYLQEILTEFQEVAERAEGIFPATVVSARELGFQEKLKLKTTMEKYTGSHLRIRYRLEPSLLGGIVFRFRDTLIDGSLQSKLKDLRNRLSATDGARA